MIGATATATEMQNNFGRYLNMVIEGKEVVVTRNGKEVGHFIPKESAVSIRHTLQSLQGYGTDSGGIYCQNIRKLLLSLIVNEKETHYERNI